MSRPSSTSETKTGFGDQELSQSQGDQKQRQGQKHGDQSQTIGDETQTIEGNPFENNQSIIAPVDVNGVTVNVKCGDTMPDSKFHPCHLVEHHPEHRRDCLCDLLEKIKAFQTTVTNAIDKQIDIYFSATSSLPNPTTDQGITDVVDCCIVKFKPISQTTVIPNTTIQLDYTAGIRISAVDTGAAPNIFDFLMDLANNTDQNDRSGKGECHCPRCATAMGKELDCAANFGLKINVSIKGLATPLSLFVFTVKDCLVYLLDDITTPTKIYVFSLSAVVGFEVPSQSI